MRDPANDTLDTLRDLGPDFPPPFSSLVRVEFASRTDPGKVRPNNEDAYVVFRVSRAFDRIATNLGDSLPERREEAGYAMILADGMGGAAAGEVASSLAIRTAVRKALDATKWALKLDVPETREKEIAEALERAQEYYRRMDAAVKERAGTDRSLAGMGTTMTTAYSVGGDLFTFHVGDSRAYISRGGKLRQLTHDDTHAQLMVDAGIITPEQAASHRGRHVLTMALGGHGELSVQMQHVELRDGDIVLLCSDGLTDMVEPDSIGAVVAAATSARAACDALVDLALERGGRDNVTVIVARYSIPARPAS